MTLSVIAAHEVADVDTLYAARIAATAAMPAAAAGILGGSWIVTPAVIGTAATVPAALPDPPAYDGHVLADAPLVYWRLDDVTVPNTTGPMLDYSGNARHGVRNGGFPGPPVVVGMVGSHLINGNDWTLIADAAWQDQAQWSVEIWFASTDTDASIGLACRDNAANTRHWDLHMNETGGGGGVGHVDISGWVTNTRYQVASTSATLNDGEPHHAVGTYDGSTLRLYVDGAETGTPVTQAGLNADVTAGLRVGGHVGINGLGGTVQCFAYYPTALSPARIDAHYSAGIVHEAADINPLVIVAGVTVHAPVAVPATVTADLIPTAAVTLGPTVTSPSIVTPAGIPVTVATPAPVITAAAAGSVAAFPIEAVTATHAPVVDLGHNATTITATATVPAHGPSANAGAARPAIEAGTLVHAPAVAAQISATITPAVIAATATVHAPTVATLDYDRQVINDGPLVYWRLDETSAAGVAHTDYSGNNRTGGNTATIASSTNLVREMARSCLMTNDSINVADVAWLDTPTWTVEIWFATTSAAASIGLACRDESTGNRHWDLHLNETATGTGRVDISGWITNTRYQIGSTETTLNDGASHHAVGTYDGTTLRLYVDGQPSGTPITQAGLNSNVAANLRLGGHFGLTGINPGTLQCFAYYPAALSAERIAAHWTVGQMPPRPNTVTATTTVHAPTVTALGGATITPAVIAAPGVTVHAPTASPPHYDLEVLTDTPLVYWRMNETGGTSVADGSGNARTGTNSATIVGATSLVSGLARGSAFTNDNLQIADAAWQDQTNWSVEIWFSTTTTTATLGLACRDNAAGARHWDMHLNEAVTGRVDIRGWTVNTASQVNSTSTSLNNGARHHAVATYDGTTLRLYIDGATTGTPVTVSGLNSNVTAPLRIGGHTGLTGITGTLQCFAYYGTALSAARVLAHYNAGIA